MTYDPTNQYRCTIIRGKSQTEMEDMLSSYAQMVRTNCPCTKEEFQYRCFRYFSQRLFGSKDFDSLPHNKQKTVKNHVTEIAGKLLGLYRTDADGYVHETESCALLLEKNDYPLFFKNLCANLQFPNGSQKIQTIEERIAKGVKIKSLCYVVSLLDYAQRQEGNKLLSKQEIGYYVLNNLDVLQGNVPVKDVYAQIMQDRANHVKREELHGSHDWQHIKEQLNLLELSNVACSDSQYIWLNDDEQTAIEIFRAKNAEPLFDFYGLDLSSYKGKKQMYADWDLYYGSVDDRFRNLETVFTMKTSPKATKEASAVGLTKNELGDKGEILVYRLECERVKRFKARLVNKVHLFSKTKGIGYDICSVEADENTSKPEFARYIEVKSTKRTTVPSLDSSLSDSFDMTANEWIAAEQYGDYYNVYRVYFTKSKIIVTRIQNPYKIYQEGKLEIKPLNYKIEFDGSIMKMQYEQTI